MLSTILSLTILSLTIPVGHFDFHEFEQRPYERPWVNKGDLVTAAPNARRIVDKLYSHGLEMFQRRFDVRDSERNVMHAFAVSTQEPPNR